MQFRSGEKAWIDVELTARAVCSKMSVTLYMLNDKLDGGFRYFYRLLGHEPLTWKQVTFTAAPLSWILNLADGTYYPSVVFVQVRHPDRLRQMGAGGNDLSQFRGAVRGIAHCFPQVIRQEIRKGTRCRPRSQLQRAESAKEKVVCVVCIAAYGIEVSNC